MTSIIKVDEIQNNAGTTTLAKLENGQLTGALSPMGMRNRIINGDMRIDQRNAGASVNSSGGGTYGVDRWKSFGSGGGVFSAQRDTVVPNGSFTNSVKLTVTTADASIAASDYYAFNQDIEGVNAADLGWGTADAQAVTLSFWVRSSVIGTYAVALYNSGGTRGYPATYSISAADTWTFVSLTIPGDTGGTWVKDNGRGITIRYDLGTGSDGNGIANTWNTSGTFAASRTSSTVNWIATSGATFYLTGVSLEKGTVATPFEFRSIGQELALCQRYFQKSYNLQTALGAATGEGSEWFTLGSYSGRIATTTRYAVSLRSDPTLTVYDWVGASGAVRTSAGNGQTGFVIRGPYQNGFTVDYTGSAISELLYQWSASAEL